jgi:hypothetical protein
MGLDMNFGSPSLQVRQPQRSKARSPAVRALFARRGVFLRGTYWLLISPASWRLVLADGLAVRDTSSVKRLNMAVARLEGEILDGLTISTRSGATTFYFDLGARLTVRPTGGAPLESELWSLNDRAHVVAIGAGGTYSYGSVKRSPEPTAPIEAADSPFIILARTGKARRAILGMLQTAAV